MIPTLSPSVEVVHRDFGHIQFPLGKLEDANSVADFLTKASDSEVLRANYKLIDSLYRVTNRQHAIQLAYLYKAVENLTTMVGLLKPPAEISDSQPLSS